MNHNIQNLTKTKTTLICLSTGKYEKRYLEKILKNKNKINYHNTDSELNQLDYRHENKDMEIKAIKGICDTINGKLNDQLSFGNQNSDYLLVVITDCDKAPFSAFDNLKNAIKNIISNNGNFSDIKCYFIFSYRGFEDWMRFYYDNGNELIKNLKSIKNQVKKDINDENITIFNNHKKAVDNYYEMVKYSEPVSSYEEIEEIPYSDFPYFFEFLDNDYNTDILN